MSTKLVPVSVTEYIPAAPGMGFGAHSGDGRRWNDCERKWTRAQAVRIDHSETPGIRDTTYDVRDDGELTTTHEGHAGGIDRTFTTAENAPGANDGWLVDEIGARQRYCM